MGEHLTPEGEFKSDKYAWCPPGFVALKLTDKDAQPFLWGYAQTHRLRDASFTDDLEQALRNKGFDPPVNEDDFRFLEHMSRAWSEIFTVRLKWLVERNNPETPEQLVAMAEQLTDRCVDLVSDRYKAFKARIGALRKASGGAR